VADGKTYSSREVIEGLAEQYELTEEEHEEQRPEELLEYAYQKLQQGLAVELLLTIKEASPRFFR